jgi:hypothetical protein
MHGTYAVRNSLTKIKEVSVKSHCFRSVAVGAALVTMQLVMASCMNNPSTNGITGVGSLELWVSVTKPQGQGVLAKESGAMATIWDSCVVKISAPDMDTLDTTFRFSPLEPYGSVSLDDVPAGKQRTVEVFTKTKANLVVHVSTPQVVDISAAEKKVLDFRLVPTLGSIYIDLTNIPTSIKRVCAAFGGLSSCEDRATKLYLSIDNIPDRTSDSLVVQGTDSSGAVLYRSTLWLVFSVARDTTLATQFCRISTNVSLTISAQFPGATVVSGFVGNARTIACETGRLIISEIMYNANDSEYIEVYNPSTAAYADSLFVEIDGTCRPLGVVAIQPKGFFVVGRRSLPWADAFPSLSSALDLSSGGNWLCLRSRASGDTVQDWVSFTGSSNNQEWPNLGSAKKSIVLDSLSTDPGYNNYGRNWAAAQTMISAGYPGISTGQYGTPKSSGM